MNCAQHTDTAAVAYCCTCGKALCEACERNVRGTIFCEPCLAARINPAAAGGKFGAGARNAGASYGPVHPPENASPGLALFLGFIPGVGAFYNGQFLKGFVHVIVFATLIWMSDHGMGGFAGVLVMAWFFYMVFDAYTTAKARREGLPIPDPLGLNAILEGKEGTFRERVEQAGERFGTQVESVAQNLGEHWQKAGGAAPGGTAANVEPGGMAPGATPGATASAASSAATSTAASTAASANQSAYPGSAYPGSAYPGANQGAPPWTPPPPPGAVPHAGAAAYVGAQGTYYAGPEGTYYAAPEVKKCEHSPVGAVVLIGLGMVFLLANLGWFSFRWIANFWPAILIVIGLWLFVKRQRGAR